MKYSKLRKKYNVQTDKKDITYIFSTEAEDLRSSFVRGSCNWGELIQELLCSTGDDSVTLLNEVAVDEPICNDDVDIYN